MSYKPEILVVDDSYEICLSLSAILEDLQVPSRFFDNSLHALNYFQSEKNPIVILDIYIPEMDGLELLQEIKEISPNTVVTMMTGERDIQAAISAIKYGAHDFLLKPFSAATVKLSIDRSLEYYHYLRHKDIYRETMENDLRFASKIQKKVIFPCVSNENSFADILSKSKISNSFFNIQALSTSKIIILFGDVEGRDVSSGFVSLTVINFFLEALLYTQEPDEIMARLNTMLINKLSTHTASCIILLLDREKQEICYTVSGMPSPLLFEDNRITELKISRSDILGILPHTVFPKDSVTFAQDTLLYLRSKGCISEAVFEDEQYLNLLEAIREETNKRENFAYIRTMIKEFLSIKQDSYTSNTDLACLFYLL
jgi:phosphoserine phosphatase RsbU/P